MERWLAVCLALFVTFLWSTSFILNQWAFAQNIGPITLAGLRYALAALTLGLIHLRRHHKCAGKKPGRAVTVGQFIGLGLAGYFTAQGFQYVGQYYVTPTQAGMLLSTGNTLFVLATGWFWLRERPGNQQAVGIAVAVGGAMLFYYPWQMESQSILGIAMILLSGIGYAIHLTITRALLRRQAATPLDLVLYPMMAGALGLVALGLILEEWPGMTWQLGGLLLWLGPVNGALAFFLWTLSQKALQAFESSALNNSVLLQVAALDGLLLGGSPGAKALFSLIIIGAGITLVQISARART